MFRPHIDEDWGVLTRTWSRDPWPNPRGRLSLQGTDLGEITGPSRPPALCWGGCRRPGLPGLVLGAASRDELELGHQGRPQTEGRSTSPGRLRASTPGRTRRGECWEQGTACTWNRSCAQPQPPRKASPDLKANTELVSHGQRRVVSAAGLDATCRAGARIEGRTVQNHDNGTEHSL